MLFRSVSLQGPSTLGNSQVRFHLRSRNTHMLYSFSNLDNPLTHTQFHAHHTLYTHKEITALTHQLSLTHTKTHTHTHTPSHTHTHTHTHPHTHRATRAPYLVHVLLEAGQQLVAPADVVVAPEVLVVVLVGGQLLCLVVL